ncbi:ABC-2 type transporter-domain-containing protein [Durotheca rogersii]|uniref:ABC-2 type transporter-domain-containing protein n=1 Tax=Durotheca rogersii TaxID=419775 RepID=UPI00221FF48C|nr:ABC-2 type transporter-domain-containing protein [Durotheca rogersii]KAI5864399.1 ABC-2 type transporter-domain-containing protein [Durotheca rogersii]
MTVNTEKTSPERGAMYADDSSFVEEDELDQVTALARRTTTTQSPDGNHSDVPNPLRPVKGTKLDPFSHTFDVSAWTKAFMDMVETDGRIPRRRSGVAFRNLDVYGYSTGSEYQASTGNIPLRLASYLTRQFRGSSGGASRGRQRIDILRDFEGLVEEGGMLLVLGPPGSGCSTLLKALAGETRGLHVGSNAHMNFRGIPAQQMHTQFRGDVLYNAEVDVHLPALTVGDTLDFAARARVPARVPQLGLTAAEYARIVRDVTMAMFRITHTENTKVGDDFVRGVSGGERKRVSIAEASLTGARFQCWDNSTRGLDSENAIQFCRNLRVQADIKEVVAAVAIYQAPQRAYELFDKVIVLYEGRQIFFGRGQDAKAYFEGLGFECPPRQTTADFLTSMTSPQERRVRAGYESKAPRTPDEFAACWKASNPRAQLLADIERYDQAHPSADRLAEFSSSRAAERSSMQRRKSPYTLSFPRQVNLCLWRGWKRLVADPGYTIAQLIFNLVIGICIGTVFLRLKNDSSTFYYRGAIIFTALLFNAFSSQMEVLTLYAQRPIVEKHERYAFYHQAAEAVSSYVTDLPYKTINMFMFNSIIYFLADLRPGAGYFFFFCLASYLVLLVMSALFRLIASITRTSHQAMVPAAVLAIGLMAYAGFAVPTPNMLGWSRWMNYINPLAYGFEALMANEFSGREFPCAVMVPSGPGYDELPLEHRICSVTGGVAGSSLVSGDRFIESSYDYWSSHKWRNIGILFGYLVFFLGAYFMAAEYALPQRSKGEVLVFRRGSKQLHSKHSHTDVESGPQSSQPRLADLRKGGDAVANNELQLAKVKPSDSDRKIFHWEDLSYDVQIKRKTRRILDHVDGWVQPGVTTVLMGSSGAGKTTLLDSLAARVTTGVISGSTLIDGKPTDRSFQSQVGYVQQQDLHLETTTVREALEFSAVLRQPAGIPREERIAYVDEVIKMLDMEDFADAIVGVPGVGLNVEQRKRLTIGVELAARPELLIFLDEPTSGLDSQTSWSICDLVDRLAKSGQAVLCTIHQPSAMLFQRFDRLLLLEKGKTVYFGEIGDDAATLIDYFERNGAPRCPPEANAAEWMLGLAAGADEESRRSEIWRASPEYTEVKAELARLRARSGSGTSDSQPPHKAPASYVTQFRAVFGRVGRHFWRSPVYTWSKILLTVIPGLYLGFTFSASDLSLQGLQNQLYAFFMSLVLLANFNEQIMPHFIPQRAIYEARERPSRIYHWSTYVVSNIIIEMAWNTLMGVLLFLCWYYPVGFYRNMTDGDVSQRSGLVLLILWQYMLFASTYSHLAIVAIDTADLAAVPASLCWFISIMFCGVGVRPPDIPHFWQFAFRASPARYLVSGVLAPAMHGSEAVCAANEVLWLAPPGPPIAPANLTCGQFLGPYAEAAGGRILDPLQATGQPCGYCSVSNSDQFLDYFGIQYSERWHNFGYLWAYIVFNAAAACLLYWLVRMPKGKKRATKKE